MKNRVFTSLVSIGLLSWACMGLAQDTRLQRCSIELADKNLKRQLVCRILKGERPCNPHHLPRAELAAAVAYLDDIPAPPSDPVEPVAEPILLGFDEGDLTKGGTSLCTDSDQNPLCNTLPSHNCELTKHSICQQNTLPPACDTSANCFTTITDCTKKAQGCDKLTLPPACTGGLTVSTDQVKCTSVDQTCALMTLPPACNTSEARCFTYAGSINCGTQGVICNKLTMYGTGCTSAGSPLCNLTFNSTNSCDLTKNWNCVNTLVQCKTKEVTDCTKGYACEHTVAISCLTFQGIVCPTGPPRPTPVPVEQEGPALLAMLPLLGLARSKAQRNPKGN